MYRPLILLLAFLAYGCGKPLNHNQSQTSASINDLINPSQSPASALAKVERGIRKLLLSQQVISQRLGLATTDFEACIPQSQVARMDSWSLACGGNSTTGQFDFTFPAGVLQTFTGSIATPEAGLGNLDETLAISNITTSTDSNTGDVTITSTFSWSLYNNIQSNKLCAMSGSLIRTVISHDSGGFRFKSLSTSQISIQCQSSPQDTTLSFNIQLTNPSITWDSSGNMTGSFSLSYNGIVFPDTVSVSAAGVHDLTSGAVQPAACDGSSLCFP